MKNVILILLVIGVCFNGYSQEEEDDDEYTNTKYGVRAAFNLSSLKFGKLKIFENKNRIGGAFGFFADVEMSEKFLFSPELQFSAAGATEDKLQIDYISVPLLFKYKIKDAFAFVIGPVPSVKVNRYFDSFDKQDSYSAKKLNKKDYNYFSFAASAGFEVRFLDPFFIDIRYYYGFTDIFTNENELTATNSIIQAGVGLKF